MLARHAGAFAAALLCFHSPLLACPLCEGDNGRQVRAGLLDEDWPGNVAASVLPFAVLAAVVAAVHVAPGAGTGRRQTPRSDRP